MARIGSKLKELRSRRGLSVREVALRSGISHSTVSLIERDRMSPSIDTLAAVVDALGTTLAGFFLDLQSSIPFSPYYRASEMTEIGNLNSVSYKVIGSNHPNRNLLMLHETYAPRSDSGEPFSHNAHEAGMVLSGAVEVTVGDQSRVLHPGDGYYFDSRLLHRFRNADEGPSRILSAITPPTY